MHPPPPVERRVLGVRGEVPLEQQSHGVALHAQQRLRQVGWVGVGEQRQQRGRHPEQKVSKWRRGPSHTHTSSHHTNHLHNAEPTCRPGCCHCTAQELSTPRGNVAQPDPAHPSSPYSTHHRCTHNCTHRCTHTPAPTCTPTNTLPSWTPHTRQSPLAVMDSPR